MAGIEILPFQATSISLAERFQTVRAMTNALAERLTPEDQMVQSCSEASPVKWHLAHSTWFFETFVLREFVPGYRPFDEEFFWLFNSYYKTLGGHPEKRLRASFPDRHWIRFWPTAGTSNKAFCGCWKKVHPPRYWSASNWGCIMSSNTRS